MTYTPADAMAFILGFCSGGSFVLLIVGVVILMYLNRKENKNGV